MMTVSLIMMRFTSDSDSSDSGNVSDKDNDIDNNILFCTELRFQVC